MAQEFIVGRTAQSPVKISDEKSGVSMSHVKITVKDNGLWELQDLGSGNGTYVKDDNGNFQRVFSKIINEHSVIRLGQEGHSSFVFMAHRVLEQDTASYAYEFQRLRKLLKRQIEDEEQMEKRNARNMQIVKLASPIALGLCVAAQFGIPGLQDRADLNLWISRIAMGAAPVAVGAFFGIDSKGVKALKQRRQKLLTCPKCGYPLSDFDIHNMQCSRCKAK